MKSRLVVLVALTFVLSPILLSATAKQYHDGGIRDISAIGNRNVGCGKGLGNWYSLDKQIAMGKTYAAQVDQESKIINDPVISEYINRLGQNLVRNSDARVPFTIKVIDSDDINAFALPGGFFYVNSGLILAADNEAELAGVMSHEIAHVAACHAAREQTRGELANLATIPLIFVGGPVGYAAENAAGLVVPMGFLKFSRTFEAQADYLGIQYMYKAGYDPNEFITFFEKIEAKEKKKPGFISKAFSTHPPTPSRVAAAQKEIDTLLPPRPEYIVDTSEFEHVKARLAALENRRKLQSPKDHRPTLRRAKHDQNSGPPVLKRRDDEGQGN
ncbi:MAG: M48 family metallopeptidase [Terriglobia bacterium]|jgi:predicted Zn-dependent protease|nr:M48 family metallopeptidase [Terriglobia bacterium]